MMMGHPYSVMIMESSLMTACAVEPGSLLMIRNLEKYSAMTKKSWCSQQNRSVPNVCHGNGRTSLTVGGSFLWEVSVFWHIAHLSTSCLMSLEMPIQHTWFLALLIHFYMPKCPLWISSNILQCMLEGISILWSFRIIPFSMESSSLKFQNLCRWLRNFLSSVEIHLWWIPLTAKGIDVWQFPVKFHSTYCL